MLSIALFFVLVFSLSHQILWTRGFGRVRDFWSITFWQEVQSEIKDFSLISQSSKQLETREKAGDVREKSGTRRSTVEDIDVILKPPNRGNLQSNNKDLYSKGIKKTLLPRKTKPKQSTKTKPNST